MNFFDYLFENSWNLRKDLLLNKTEPISFERIFNESRKIASWLRRELGQGKKILLISSNNEFFITSYLGIVKSGNVCVPLNPQIESEVLDYIIKKTDPPLVFFSESFHYDPTVECINETNLKIILEEEIMLDWESDFDGSQLATIMYTSGSTSLPKGVMLSHNNIIANTQSIIKSLDLAENDIVMVVLPFYYCYGLSLLHTHIRVGGSVVLNNNFMFFSQTLQQLNYYKCTGFAGVPSHFQLLLRKTDILKETDLTFLRYVTQAGGRLHTTFIKEFIHLFPNVKFFVMYGQTEATARLSILPPEILEKKLGSIGKGIEGVEILVVDEQGVPVSPGETGEIIVRGNNVMQGYFDDPVSTAEVLKNGWLYTGDLATIDEDGYLYITARKKEIIKIGGVRISPKEIEDVIVKMDGVIDCTVEAVYDENLGEAIKAVVIVNEYGKLITADDLKRFCGTKLAPYKIPTYIYFNEKLDVSPSGKKVKRI